MKKTIMAMVATLAMASAASASDLPGRNSAPAPTPARADYPTSWYVGVNAGSTAGTDKFSFDGSRGVIGGVAGYEVNSFLRVEGAFTNRFSGSNTKDGQMATANAIGQYTIPGTAITPYVLGGVGYGWNYYGDPDGKAAALWNAGGGVRYAVSKNWEIDGRYKYIQQFKSYGDDGRKGNENSLTAGVNYKF
jgi:opacity protein-like surface antigen